MNRLRRFLRLPETATEERVLEAVRHELSEEAALPFLMVDIGSEENALLFARLVRVVLKAGNHLGGNVPAWVKEARVRVDAKSMADDGATRPSPLLKPEFVEQRLAVNRLARAAIARSDAFKATIPEEERTKTVLEYDAALDDVRKLCKLGDG